jgi:hypothetical protein
MQNAFNTLQLPDNFQPQINQILSPLFLRSKASTTDPFERVVPDLQLERCGR